jgi:hypothetical protein
VKTNVGTGTVRGTIGDIRTEEDFVAFKKDLLASASPTAAWHEDAGFDAYRDAVRW